MKWGMLSAALVALSLLLGCFAQAGEGPGNLPDRVEAFRDAGFGLFIHWSLDSQLGSVISHSLVGASEDYVDRYFTELPKTFNPKKFDPEEWAVLAKLAGCRYVVFTAKHHSGFCMFHTATTEFGIKPLTKKTSLRSLSMPFASMGWPSASTTRRTISTFSISRAKPSAAAGPA